MEKQLIECVPNISEGRNSNKINAIANVVKSVEGVQLLYVDPGKATNRTVITFIGEPDNVIEAAYRLIKKAAELIDMSLQTGTHPRFGATDVCPLIPIANITVEETVKYAHRLGNRIGKELGISGYYYEYAATEGKRKNLANCRSGEYEGLKEKITNPSWKLDFGPTEYNEQIIKSGVTAISARNFLIAYNVNLNTKSVEKANSISYDVRESGRILRKGNSLTGEKAPDNTGKPTRIPGKLKAVKGFGWYIEEYKLAQVSYNLTNIEITPIHQVFEETVNSAIRSGVKVTGSELIGLIPLKAILEAADYYLAKENKSLFVSESEKVKLAIQKLGLDDIKPFNPEERIIEYNYKKL